MIRLWRNLPEQVAARQIIAPALNDSTFCQLTWAHAARASGWFSQDNAGRSNKQLYRRRWCVEGMFQHLEAALHSEIRSLGHPRAALLGFAVAVLAYNVLALLQRCIERAHRATHPSLQVSAYHLALQIRGSYEGMLIALPVAQWSSYGDADPATVAAHLTRLARNVVPRQVAASPRGPKHTAKKGYVDAAVARAHVATARVSPTPKDPERSVSKAE